MKRFLVVTLLVLVTGSTWAQEGSRRTGGAIERIAVIPFVNTTELQQWDNLAEAMTETVRLTLTLSGRFDVVNPDTSGIDPYAPEGPLQLRRIADERRIDGAVIGRISQADNGRVELETSVWSSFSGQIIGQERREAFGSFDVLDTADELVALTTSALLGYRADFGGIMLNPSRLDVEYLVSIDGNPVGANVRSIPQVLVGQRRIAVSVVMSGRNRLVYSVERRIRPGEAINVTFGLPQVTRQEQEEILVLHALARNLMGQPDNCRVACDALSESRALLAMAGSNDAIESLREEQRALEGVWQLDEEFHRFSIAAVIENEVRSEAYQDTYRLIESEEIDDPAIRVRLQRNGAAYYHLLRIMWAHDLGASRWDQARSRLDTMKTVVAEFQLQWLAEEIAFVRRAFNTASDEAELVQARRRRPWPYLGIAVGVSGMSYGGYLLATNEEVFAGERETLLGREFARSDLVQWGSIGLGGVITAVSSAVLVRNVRAGESYLRDWARSEYGSEIDRAAEILTISENTAEDGSARVLVLGPVDQLAMVEGDPRFFPMLVNQDPGLPLDVGQAPIVSEERSRLYGQGVSMLVVR